MKCSGELKFEFPNPSEAEKARVALVGSGSSGERCSVRVFCRGNAVVVEAAAVDSVALRATLNTYLRHMQVIEGLKGD